MLVVNMSNLELTFPLISVTVHLITTCLDEANKKFNKINSVENCNPEKRYLFSILRAGWPMSTFFSLEWDQYRSVKKALQWSFLLYANKYTSYNLKRGTSIIPQIFDCHSKIKVSFVQFPKRNLKSSSQSFSWDS